MSSEGSQTSPIILPDSIQQKKISGGRPKSLVWENHIKREKKYLKVIMKPLVYIVIPFGIKVHLKF